MNLLEELHKKYSFTDIQILRSFLPTDQEKSKRQIGPRVPLSPVWLIRLNTVPVKTYHAETFEDAARKALE